MDESGDLGFTPDSTRSFVVAYLVTNNPHPSRTKILRLKKKMNQRKKGLIKEFKFSQDSHDVRIRMLEEIKKCELDVGYVVIDKSSVRQALRVDPARLYRFIVINYVITNLVSAYDLTSIRFVVDKSLSREGRLRFNTYLIDKLSWRQVVEKGSDMPTVDIVHLQSEGEPCLQVADYYAGAAFARYERGNSTYYDMIREGIKFKTPWGKIDW